MIIHSNVSPSTSHASRSICVVGAGRWGMNHVRTLHGLGCLAGIVEADEDTRAGLCVK